MDPIAEAGRRGYRFSGNLSIGRLLSGEALQPGTREILVTPAGSARVTSSEDSFAQLAFEGFAAT
jgi:hypothetical protein